MIDRIRRRMVPPLVGLLRASIRNSQCLSTTSRLRPRPRPLPCPPVRSYASPPPGEFRPPLPADPRLHPQGPYNPSYQQFHQDPNYSLPPQHPPPLPPRPKRSLRPYIYATLFFLIGNLAGHFIRFIVIPPGGPLPAPGTPEDAALTAHIHKRAAQLPIVQALSEDPEWRSWDAYSTFTPEEKLHRITTGPLGGSRGIGGYQRIFHHPASGQFISVVWLGAALSGWPGVAHGGLIAMVMDESMGRCAIGKFPVQTGMTAKLEFNFRVLAWTNAFYIVRAWPVAEGSTERKGFVLGRLETVDGKACVEASGLFVVPKKVPETALKRVELKNLDEGF
jgi:acyl-coenzyme A thioesterase PaaI-like protein